MVLGALPRPVVRSCVLAMNLCCGCFRCVALLENSLAKPRARTDFTILTLLLRAPCMRKPALCIHYAFLCAGSAGSSSLGRRERRSRPLSARPVDKAGCFASTFSTWHCAMAPLPPGRDRAMARQAGARKDALECSRGVSHVWHERRYVQHHTLHRTARFLHHAAF